MVGRGLAALAIVLYAPLVAQADPRYPFQDPHRSVETRLADFVGRLMLPEKVSLLSGRDNWHLPAIARLGVRELVMTDGPAGLRSFESEPSTAFPVGVAAAATWDPELIRAEGRAIGEETVAQGVDIILGPMANLVRVPQAGRNFEAFSEDPVLVGAIGTAYVLGVQSAGGGATVKHFVGNEQENGRNTGNSVISERALHEIYLAAFEPIVRNADPWCVMTTYPHVNGIYASESPLIADVLRRDWNYQGVVMSDWTGTHSTAPAIKAGLDLEMPGPTVWRGWTLMQAVNSGAVSGRDIDSSVRRIAGVMLKAGLFDDSVKKLGSLNTPEHQAVAERVAAEGTVLLKNDGDILPLDKARVKTVAVIGAAADRPAFQGGGSSQVVPYRVVSPLAALRAHYGDAVKFVYVEGVDNEPRIPAIDVRLLSPAIDRKEEGLHATYFRGAKFQDGIAFERTESRFLKFGFGHVQPDWSKMPHGLKTVHDALTSGDYTRDLWKAGIGFSVRWSGYFHAPRDGMYEFSLVHDDSATLTFNGRVLVDDRAETHPAPIFPFFKGLKERRASIALKGGAAYPIEVDFSATPTSSINWDQRVFQLGARVPGGTADEAVAAARDADVAVVFAGSGTTAESEGNDRSGIDFDPAQTQLIEAVAAANPHTIVVVNEGGAVTMPWKDKVQAILDEWLPGQEGGSAIAGILFGDIDPSGRLPITFPDRIEDNPAFLSYSGGATQFYDDDVFVGYRAYEKRKIAPLWGFGYGLSYTNFAVGPMAVPESVQTGGSVPLSLTVTNTGARAGAEVIQLYVQDDHAPVPEPVKSLKAFSRVELAAGETKRISFQLAPRDLSYWDVATHQWTEDPGKFNVMAGVSSSDIRALASFTVQPGNSALPEAVRSGS